MRRAFFILGAILVWQVAAWAFAPPAPPTRVPEVLEVNRGKAFGAHEDLMKQGRARQRHDAIRALELPWASRCVGTGRSQFISGLDHYYYHRQNQTERHPETYGKPGADYIARQWSTADDQRIDRLTQDAYANGYLKLTDFKGLARQMITTVVKDERVIGNACAG